MRRRAFLGRTFIVGGAVLLPFWSVIAQPQVLARPILIGADDCAWTAATQTPWIAITGAPSGKGDGEVRYRVAPNPGPARDGALTVADRTIAIKQEGASQKRLEIKGRIDNLHGGCPSLTFSVGDKAVQTTSDTRYEDGGCGSLRSGMKVEVKGVAQSNGGPVIAQEINVKEGDN